MGTHSGWTDTEDPVVSSKRVRLHKSALKICLPESRKARKSRLAQIAKEKRLEFAKTLSPHDRLVLLRQGRQGVVRYTRQFCAIVSEIPLSEQNDQKLKRRYIDGLAYPVQIWLTFFSPKTCADTIAIAVAYETNYWSFLGSRPAKNAHDHHAVGTEPHVSPVEFDSD